MMDAKICRNIGGTWNSKTKDCSVYRVTTEDIQIMAESRFGKKLNEDELFQARKGIESGLGEGLDIVLNTAIEEALKHEN